jgi:hypothetical protein
MLEMMPVLAAGVDGQATLVFGFMILLRQIPLGMCLSG